MCVDRRNDRELGGDRGVSGFRPGVVGDDRSNRGHEVQGDVGRNAGEGREKAGIVTGRTPLKPDIEESNGNRAARGVGASAGRGIPDVVPHPELGLSAQRRIGHGAADRAPARLVDTVLSRRELGSEDEHGWIGTPEEMLDALLNRPAPRT